MRDRFGNLIEIGDFVAGGASIYQIENIHLYAKDAAAAVNIHNKELVSLSLKFVEKITPEEAMFAILKR